jgi:hypothetical protein
LLKKFNGLRAGVDFNSGTTLIFELLIVLWFLLIASSDRNEWRHDDQVLSKSHFLKKQRLQKRLSRNA